MIETKQNKERKRQNTKSPCDPLVDPLLCKSVVLDKFICSQLGNHSQIIPDELRRLQLVGAVPFLLFFDLGWEFEKSLCNNWDLEEILFYLFKVYIISSP